jgi:hypothetical protein
MLVVAGQYICTLTQSKFNAVFFFKFLLQKRLTDCLVKPQYYVYTAPSTAASPSIQSFSARKYVRSRRRRIAVHVCPAGVPGILRSRLAALGCWCSSLRPVAVYRCFSPASSYSKVTHYILITFIRFCSRASFPSHLVFIWCLLKEQLTYYIRLVQVIFLPAASTRQKVTGVECADREAWSTTSTCLRLWWIWSQGPERRCCLGMCFKSAI